MAKTLATLAILFASVASAQSITSYRANNPAPVGSDANKLVCQKEETIGSRLGGKKVCLTVSQWKERQAADKDLLERVQSGVHPPCSADPGQCGTAFGPNAPH